jgi:hypothetical protein
MSSILMQSTDSGAPILENNTFGSLLSLLKACLVDGYGTTQPLGWSLEFEDVASHTSVFRPGAGVRPFVKIKEVLTAGNWESCGEVTVFESMSDYNIGYFPMPAFNNITYRHISYCSTTHNGEIPWKIIGDERGVWLCFFNYYLQYGNDSYGKLVWPHYIGDFTCNDTSFKHNFIVCLQQTNTTFNVFHGNKYEPNSILRDWKSREAGSVSFRLAPTILKNNSVIGNNYYDQSIGGKIFYDPIYILSDPVSYVQGCVPGALSRLHSYSDSGDGATNEQLDSFFDYQSDKTVWNFCMRYDNASYSSFTQSLGIIIGEGFRNAR